MARSIDCELWANNWWERIDMDLALRMPPGRQMRCVDCHGRVRAHREGTTGQAARMEHLEAHPGRARGNIFDGVSRTPL